MSLTAASRSRRAAGRARAVFLSAALAAVVVALSGCQSRLGAAAVVGDQRVSVGQLDSVVTQSLDGPGVREALPSSDYKGDLGQYRRTLLGIKLESLLADTTARRRGVTVDSSEVDSRYRFYEHQAGGAAAFARTLAAKSALTPSLFRELVRTEVVQAEIGWASGEARRPTGAELSRLYQSYVGSVSSVVLSLIQVPDQATATSVLAQVRRDPNSFAQVAAKYPAADTRPQPQQYGEDQLPAQLRAQLSSVKAGDVFVFGIAGSGAPAYYVVRFGGRQQPSLEAVRPQLENQSLQQAAQVGRKFQQQVAQQVGVSVNPRFGSWDQRRQTITDTRNPVLQTPIATPAVGGTVGGGAGSGSTEAPTGTTGG